MSVENKCGTYNFINIFFSKCGFANFINVIFNQILDLFQNIFEFIMYSYKFVLKRYWAWLCDLPTWPMWPMLESVLKMLYKGLVPFFLT
jgi:hypothetical protein